RVKRPADPRAARGVGPARRRGGGRLAAAELAHAQRQRGGSFCFVGNGADRLLTSSWFWVGSTTRFPGLVHFRRRRGVPSQRSAGQGRSWATSSAEGPEVFG